MCVSSNIIKILYFVIFLFLSVSDQLKTMLCINIFMQLSVHLEYKASPIPFHFNVALTDLSHCLFANFSKDILHNKHEDFKPNIFKALQVKLKKSVYSRISEIMKPV